jgi:tellurite methyltransferase
MSGAAEPAYDGPMTIGASVSYFDAQFRKQLQEGELRLNPFELKALAYARGDTLDFGCGLGNFALAAAERGCKVVALDASPAAIQHIREAAAHKLLAVDASNADLSCYVPAGMYDTVACIGLLMFFDCATAQLQLKRLQQCVRGQGVLIVNVLVQGTTYMDMFDPSAHCLFGRSELFEHFADWDILDETQDDFPAPNGSLKSFVTLVARKPAH